MNTDLMLARDSDQEKLVGSHPEGDADTCARERNNSCLPLLAAVRGLQFENRQKYQKKRKKKNLLNLWQVLRKVVATIHVLTRGVC